MVETGLILSGEFVALGLNAITYYSTLRHLVLVRLLVISKSRPSLISWQMKQHRKAFFGHIVPKNAFRIRVFLERARENLFLQKMVFSASQKYKLACFCCSVYNLLPT